MHSADYWVKHLNLVPHPEGGYYRRSYLSEEHLRAEHLPQRFQGGRAMGSAIYFLLDKTDISALHRIKSDEIWHFYLGASIQLYLIDAKGKLEIKKLGINPEAGELPQAVIPAGSWFGAKLSDPTSFSLLGCTVAPAFDFNDFEFGKRAELIKLYPAHKAQIEMLTK